MYCLLDLTFGLNIDSCRVLNLTWLEESVRVNVLPINNLTDKKRSKRYLRHTYVANTPFTEVKILLEQCMMTVSQGFILLLSKNPTFISRNKNQEYTTPRQTHIILHLLWLLKKNRRWRKRCSMSLWVKESLRALSHPELHNLPEAVQIVLLIKEN